MSGNAVGTIAKIGIPLALTAVTGGMAAPLAAASDGLLSPVAAGAILGAAGGAAGSTLTGGNPVTGAALGGIGGGIGQTEFAKNLLNGANSTAAAPPAGETGIGGYNGNEPLSPEFVAAHPELNTGVVSPTTPTASGGIGGFMSRNALPIAGGLAVLATSNNSSNMPSAPQGDTRQPNNITPLQRTQVATNPQAYYGVGGQRQAFDVVNPTVNPTLHYADGGSVPDKSDMQKNLDMAEMTRARMSGHPMEPQANFIIERYRTSGYPGSLSQYVGDEYANTPIASVIQANEKSVPQYSFGGAALFQKARGPSYFKQGAASPLRKPLGLAAGGQPGVPQIPQVNMPRQGIGSMVQGAGDGQSDQIPAMLSDGEYVIPAPVVSALGRGSNAAGAKKLDKAKAHIMSKTYKKGKPPAARMGLGSMGIA